jgi:hypothetical protein
MYTLASVPAPALLPVYTVTLYLDAERYNKKQSLIRSLIRFTLYLDAEMLQQETKSYSIHLVLIDAEMLQQETRISSQLLQQQTPT